MSSTKFNSLDAIDIVSPDGKSTATILLHGATLVSYKIDGEELLFVSDEAVYAPPKASKLTKHTH